MVLVEGIQGKEAMVWCSEMKQEVYGGVPVKHMGITTSYQAGCEGVLAAAEKAYTMGWFRLYIVTDSKAATTTAFNSNSIPWQLNARWKYITSKVKIRLEFGTHLDGNQFQCKWL
ncbi:hypothetical protein GIB67_024959 [Kingdonia uniflora]|uniref:RNase H type-1 domain-containing protein n=1 Tax=Kingdonia uniflora TaxID=39325 RepID=A0A7J7NYU3_9MAGN|nr:hypothetical protein GIB67_024959 [Kingdonia uniflora]